MEISFLRISHSKISEAFTVPFILHIVRGNYSKKNASGFTVKCLLIFVNFRAPFVRTGKNHVI